MRLDVIQHEIAAMSAADVVEVAYAAISRIGELGREAGEAFKARALEYQEAAGGDPHFEEGMGWVAE